MADGQSVQKVQLGCGTLILIALIVLLFSRSGGNNGSENQLETEVRNLKSEVIQLKHSIELQTKQIETLQSKIDAARNK